MSRAYVPRTLPIVMISIAALLSGCRENEQNRPLAFEPHVYKGQKLPSLTAQQQRELQERGGLQR